MSDKRRRLDKLGAGRPDPALRAMSDAELQAAYARQLSGEAAAAREREAASRDPLLGHLVDLGDDALIQEYEMATAAVVAELQAMTDAQFRAARTRASGTLAPLHEAEARRRWPTPPPPEPPVVEPVAAPPLEPHPIALEPATPEPPPMPQPGAHVSCPVDDCDCLLCAEHRALAHQDERERALAKLYENEPMEGAVRVAPNASAEFAAAVRGRQP